jgi:hypothetical protein
VLVVYMAATCQGASTVQACALDSLTPKESAVLDKARQQAGFDLLFPCYLPNAQTLESSAVTGDPGRQAASLVWTGPFDFTISQSQFPPAVSADPSGSSRVTVDLFPDTQADLIERNDATSEALYHLLWQRDEVYYELLAYGPPQQRRIILEIARSLQ